MILNDKKIDAIIDKFIKAGAKEGIKHFVLGFRYPDDKMPDSRPVWRFQSIQIGSLIVMLKDAMVLAVENLHATPILPEEKQIYSEMMVDVENAVKAAADKMRTLKAQLELKKN